MSSSATLNAVISTASYPITLMGVTGNTGGNAVNTLLAHNDSSNIFIRGIVRSQVKGEAWKTKLSEKFGADKVNKQVTFVVADQRDTAALSKAFAGSTAVYVLLCPEFPDAAYDLTKQRVAIYTEALKAAKVDRIVALSSLGAHLELDQCKTGAIYQLNILEKGLVKQLSSTATITSIRAGGFFENALHGDFPKAKKEGKFGSFYQHLDRKYARVSTKDIGAEIAKHLIDRSERKTPLYVELEGPERYSLNDFAAVYSKVFGLEVAPFFIPQSEWTGIFESIGIPRDRTFCREDMYAGHNSGKLGFENEPKNGTISVKGVVTLEEGLTELIAKWEVQQTAVTLQKTV